MISVGAEEFPALEFGDSSAPPVLLLHGFPDHPPSFEPFATRLAELGYRVVVPWLRGYWPAPLSGAFDLRSLAADAIAMLEAIATETEQRFLVGHDWGAAITCAACASGADVDAAVMISVPHLAALSSNAMRSAAQLRRSSYMARFQPASADDMVAADGFAFVRELWRAWSPGYALPEGRWLELRRTLEASHPFPLAYYRAQAKPKQLAWMRGLSRRPIPCDTTTIFGSDDGCISADMAAGSHRFFARSFSLEVVPGAGHFIHLERPERLAELVALRLR